MCALLTTVHGTLARMSFQICWRCVSKASDSVLISRRPAQQAHNILPASTVLFSTSASLGGVPPKKSPKLPETIPKRGRSRNFVATRDKKAVTVDRGKRPAVGERKALRKRIVLSNTNALEVHGMRDVAADSMVDEGLRGQVLGIPGPVVDQLRAVEAFQVPQSWALFRRPAMLIRRETMDFGRDLEQIEREKKSIRRVLVGDRGSGKSLLVLQAMTMAFLKRWVVVNIPNGKPSSTLLQSKQLRSTFQLKTSSLLRQNTLPSLAPTHLSTFNPPTPPTF